MIERVNVCRGCGDQSLPDEECPGECDAGFDRYAVVECACGEIVWCYGFTTTCDCGADYNWNGARLTPRSCWGEETGEVFA